MSKWIKPLALMGILFCTPLLAADVQVGDVEFSSAFEKSVVLLSTSSQVWDSHSPWSKREPQIVSGLGTVIDGGRILTSAYMVRGSVQIEGRRLGQSRRFELEPILVDYEINLAILRPKEARDLEGMRPVTIGGALDPGRGVGVIKDRDTYRLTRIQGRIVEVSMLRAATSSYGVATYLIETKAQGLGWAEPVVSGNTLVGLTTGQDEAGLYAVPSSIITMFLERAKKTPYPGFAFLGVSIRALADPYMRRELGVGEIKGGVRIVKVFPSSPFYGRLKEDDVLIAVNGNKISEFGDVIWQPWGRVPLQVILNTLPPGNKATLLCLRKGEKTVIEGVLTPYSSNRSTVPFFHYGAPEPHLIFGGAVFQELSRDYLMLWGKEWQETAPIDFLYTYEFDSDPSIHPDDRVLILNRVLPDEFNRGYESQDNNILESVNGFKPKNIEQLKQALQKPVLRDGKPYAVFMFKGPGGEMVLGYNGLGAAQERIRKNFGIPFPDSFFTYSKP